MGRILCVNKSYIPIRTTSPYNFVGKLFTNMAEVVHVIGNSFESYDWEKWIEKSMKNDWPEDTEFLHSSKLRIAIPRVIRYTSYDKIPKVSIKLSRRAIYERDHYTCYLCGHEFSEGKLSIDHVKPFALGGRNEWTNMATCCKACNSNKGHKTLAELGIKPKFMPYKPTLSNMQKLKGSLTTIYPEWKLFI